MQSNPVTSRHLLSKRVVLKQIPISGATMWRTNRCGRFPKAHTNRKTPRRVVANRNRRLVGGAHGRARQHEAVRRFLLPLQSPAERVMRYEPERSQSN